MLTIEAYSEFTAEDAENIENKLATEGIEITEF